MGVLYRDPHVQFWSGTGRLVTVMSFPAVDESRVDTRVTCAGGQGYLSEASGWGRFCQKMKPEDRPGSPLPDGSENRPCHS
jgi:hypothetical protein